MLRVTIVAISVFALAVLSFPSDASAAGKTKLMANAIVKSVSPTSLTVTAEGKDTTFAVDAKTSVVGKGVGTKAAEKGKGGKAAINVLLDAGDRVSVTYEEGAAPMRAAKVDLVAKKDTK